MMDSGHSAFTLLVDPTPAADDHSNPFNWSAEPNPTGSTVDQSNPYDYASPWTDYYYSATASEKADDDDDDVMTDLEHGSASVAGPDVGPVETTLDLAAAMDISPPPADDDDFDEPYNESNGSMALPHPSAAFNLPGLSLDLLGLQPPDPAQQQQAPQLPPGNLFPVTIDPVNMQISLADEVDLFGDLIFNDPAAPHPPGDNVQSLAPLVHTVDFLRQWAQQGRGRRPALTSVLEQMSDTSITRTRYDDLQGDKCDLQGIDWEDIGVSRHMARRRRLDTVTNYTNIRLSDRWHPRLPDRKLNPCENYFRFRNMDIRRDVRLLHFQLRNTLDCASRTRAFYPAQGCVRELDPTTGRTRKAMKFGPESDVQVTTLTAIDNLLVAGTFSGDYLYRNLDSEDPSFTEGKLTYNVSGITNHVQVYPARLSSGPVAAYASNDYGFRVLDLTTDQFVSNVMYEYPLNCTAISPDKRLRVMVGDKCDVRVVDAESGEILKELDGHRDWGFACDWAPDGVTVATGFQDKTVRIWDARMWTNTDGHGNPLAVLRMDMTGARSLHFSPLGSGKRLLVAAEETDLINIIDAQTFKTKQTFDIFGEIGGTTFTNDGQSLMALICDRHRGGVLQIDRCDQGAEDAWMSKRSGRPLGYDWMTDPDEIIQQPGSQDTLSHRSRVAVALDDLTPF